MAWPAGARPPGELQVDDAACERIPYAAALLTKDYLVVPAAHRAKSLPVVDVRRLFDRAEAHKVDLIKKSIAEENPVLCTARTPGSSSDGGTWVPSRDGSQGRSAAHRQSQCAMIVVGYDDARGGGAFEVMPSCGANRSSESFFWVRYDDLDQFCGCAVEVIGRRHPTEPPTALTGGLRFQAASGVIMHAQRHGRLYRLARTYRSGARFRVLVTTDGPAYVYVFASDLTRKVYPIFPEDGGSAHLAYRDNHVAIPDEKSYLQLDAKSGTDYICALYSTRKLEFSTLIHQIGAAQGNFVSRLQAVLGKDLMPEAGVRYATAGDIGFTTKSADGSVVLVVVEIPHVR